MLDTKKLLPLTSQFIILDVFNVRTWNNSLQLEYCISRENKHFAKLLFIFHIV